MSRDALVIGINQYTRVENLKSPARDADKIAQLLKDYGQFNVVKLLPAVKDKDNIIRVGRQTPVSGVELEKAIGEFLNPEGKSVPSTAFLFFSGHGVRKISGGVSEGFLAASDTNPGSGNWGLSLRWLRQVLELSPIRQQIICLDCCHSGEVLNFKEADPGSAGNAHDRCFIAASREYELAYEEADGSHGLLSGALIKGLPPESRVDGIVTNYSLTDVVIQTLRGSQQQPVFSNSGSPIEITRKTVSFIQPTEEPVSSKCPYKGLHYFDFNDEDPKYFYGRTALTEELIDKVRKSSFLAVIGASGSGKSSTVRAGLLYKLRLGKSLAGSDRWPIRIFTPDEHPMTNLAWAFVDPCESNTARAKQFKEAKELIDSDVNGFAALIAAAAGDGRVVLVIDQFEEVFTLCKKESERRKFFEILLGALPLTESRLCLIIAMRADFFSKCTEEEYSGLSKYIQDNLVTITPMTQEELKLAIIEPAKKVNIIVEHELVKQMVDDIHDSRGSLPLLQYTLTELWSKREDNVLRLSAYSAMGGVKGALAERADEVYESLNAEEQDAAKRIFMELTHLGEGTEDTRRRVFKTALVTPKQPEELINKVIYELTRANLIVTDEVRAESEHIPVVDVAHEALIRHWPLLRQWLNTNREDLRFKHKLDDAAKEWDRQGKHDGLLWRSPLLEILKEHHNKYKDDMSHLELAFYEASIKAKERIEQEEEEARGREMEHLKAIAGEKEQKAKAQKKANRFLMGIILVVLIATVIIGFTAFRNFQYAEKQKVLTQIAEGERQKAQIERDKAQSLLAKNYWSNAVNEKKNNNLLKSIHYLALSGKEELKTSLVKNCISNIQKSSSIFLAAAMKHDFYVRGATFNHDDTLILSWGSDRVKLWNAMDGSLAIKPMKHGFEVNGAIFNHDETLILSWGSDGIVRLWNAIDGSSAAKLMKHDSYISGAIFNHDDTLILSWGSDRVRLWNAKDGSPAAMPMKHEDYVWGAIFNRDETLILSWSKDGTVKLWNAIDGSLAIKPMKHGFEVSGAIFNHDETLILSWGTDGTVRLWNAIDGSPAAMPMEHEDYVWGAIFNRDETLILSWSGDIFRRRGEVRLWNAKDGSLAAKPMKHEDSVSGAIFNHDETLILSWGSDGTVRLWNAKDGSLAIKPMKHDSYVSGAKFNHDDTLILSWGSDTVRLWNAKDGSLTAEMKHDALVLGAKFNQVETLILSCSSDGTVRLWNAKDGPPAAKPMKHDSSVRGAIFNHDDTLILSCSSDTVRLWNTIDGSLAAKPMKHEDHVWGAILNHDDTLILSWSSDTVRLWNAKDGSLAAKPMKHDSEVSGAIFNQDETLILSWSRNGTVKLLNAKDGSPAAEMKHDSYVSGAIFNHDDTLILSWGLDAVRLWNAKDGSPAAKPMKHEDSVRGAMFNHDDTLILSWGLDAVRLWNAKDGSSAAKPMKHEDSVREAMFNHDDTLILSWGSDTVRLWNAKDGSLAAEMKHVSYVSGAIFNQDETLILSWSRNGTVKLWNAKDGSSAAKPMKHEDSVWGAIFNQDETLILSWSDDRTVRLWNARDGSPVAKPMKHEDSVWGAILNHDDTLILSWSDDRTVRLWNIAADYDFPKKHLPLLINVMTGTKMDDYGNVSVLSEEQWNIQKKEYIKIAKEHEKECKYKKANLYLRQKVYWGDN